MPCDTADVIVEIDQKALLRRRVGGLSLSAASCWLGRPLGEHCRA